MTHDPNRTPAESTDRRRAAPACAWPVHAALAAALALACGAALSDGGDHASSPTQLRGFVAAQVGGIEKLTVPANDADLPQPRLANGSPDPTGVA